MPAARIPHDEPARLAALAAFEVLDSDADARFDALTQLLASILDVPIALVSLVDAKRQWFKSRVGLDARETDRDVAFCAHAILSDELLIVEDATTDPRFRDNPLVQDGLRVRFYAGAPLCVDAGLRLGTLCAIDQRPRQLGPREREQLRLLARQVVALLELHRVSHQLADALARVRTLSELIPICAHCRKIRDAHEWHTLESYVAAQTGSRFSHGICPACLQLHFPEHAEGLVDPR
jgi:GAF domain-containing protein